MTHRGVTPGHEWTAVRLSHERPPKQDDLEVIASGVDQAQFSVLFSLNGERNGVRDENRGDRELRSIGGWCQNLSSAAWPGRARPKNVGCLRAIVRGKVWAGPTPAVGEMRHRHGRLGPAG